MHAAPVPKLDVPAGSLFQPVRSRVFPVPLRSRLEVFMMEYHKECVCFNAFRLNSSAFRSSKRMVPIMDPLMQRVIFALDAAQILENVVCDVK